MWKKILLAAALAILGFVAVVAMQPSQFRVSRAAVIAAPAAEIFAQINDFHNWQKWSPWVALDPAAKLRFEGPNVGRGAVFAWSGNANIGEGRMILIDSRPNERIQIKLEFVRPMAGTSEVEFRLKPLRNRTTVTWIMSGQNDFLGKAMCLFFSLDATIGGDFERGLTKLQALVESSRRI